MLCPSFVVSWLGFVTWCMLNLFRRWSLSVSVAGLEVLVIDDSYVLGCSRSAIIAGSLRSLCLLSSWNSRDVI